MRVLDNLVNVLFTAHGTGGTHQLLIRLLTCVEELKQTQKIHSGMLRAIMNQQQLSGSQPVPELPEDLKFPLTTASEVTQLESKLQDSTVKGTLVSFLLVHALLIFITDL